MRIHPDLVGPDTARRKSMGRIMPDPRHRYIVLDAWRGISALLVTVVHIPVAHAMQGQTAFTNMQLFVDFFFVLSGFVIVHAYGDHIDDPRTAKGFMIRRFGRVWPLHAVVIGGFLALEFLKLALDAVLHLPLDGVPFSGNRSLETLLSNLALTQAFNLHGMTSWNGPAWSIGVEFYTYLVFAIVVLAAGVRAGLFAAMACVGLAGVVLLSPKYLFTTHDFGFFRCLYGFFVGTLVALAVQRSASRPGLSTILPGTSGEVAAVALLIGFILLTGETVSSLLAPLVFAAVIYVFAFERGRISALLTHAVPQALGLWSYSIYMVHMLVFAVMKIALTFAAKFPEAGLSAPITAPVKLWTFGTPTHDGLLMLVAVVVVVGVSGFTHARIEDPARRGFNALAKRYEAARGPTVSVRRTFQPAAE